MYNNRTPYSPYPPRVPSESYPTPAPTPQINEVGMPIPFGAPKRHPIPLPPTPYGGVYLHPLLAYASCPCIEYDVRHQPSSASAPNARLEWRYESVTNPPASEIIITCMVLPRPFIVRPLSREYDFITIYDLLSATYSALRNAPDIARPANNVLFWCPNSSASAERYKWAGLSEQRAPGNWLLHIE